MHIGTCSWKYDSWQGLICPEKKPFNYLEEYSKHYNCVEVDQWFWSLFPCDKFVLPRPEVVQEYADSVPQDFRFGIKVPNSITLTHHYKKHKEQIKDMAVIRLHGPDRQGIEKVTGKDWSQVVAPKDEEVLTLAKMLPYMESRGVQTFTFVNNHFEGSAPRTIEKILSV